MDTAAVNQAADNLITLVPILGKSPTAQDCRAALELMECLLVNEPDNPLVDILCAKIRQYEDTAPELAEFNARVAATPPGVAMLRLIIDQHNLTLSDLPEIGRKSHVSLVLSGKRSLRMEHIRKLSARFGLPASLFIDGGPASAITPRP